MWHYKKCFSCGDTLTLQEFSLALMGLMVLIKQSAPSQILNADIFLCDQSVKHVIHTALHQELKQLMRR